MWVVVIFILMSFASLPVMGMRIMEKCEQKISVISCSNSPPDKPRTPTCHDPVNGDQVDWGYAKKEYNFLTRTFDPDGDDVRFTYDWDDGTTTTTRYISSGGWFYQLHEYEQGGTYSIRVQAKDKYGGVSEWSDPLEIQMIDHCDLDIIQVYTDPEEFGPGDNINILAEVKNIGTVPTTQTTQATFYYTEFDQIDVPQPIGILQPDESQTVSVPFKWFDDKYTHSVRVEVDFVPGERTDINNIEIGNFIAPYPDLESQQSSSPLSYQILQRLMNIR